ncbi:MAG: helix-turn-helix domain-containing protein [Saprospiraceae bacterium]|nr:helix-turn-helix domain-containing protein [Saprospiraceae bacterium]
MAQEAEDALWSSIQKMYRVALDGENLYNGPIKFVKPKASKKPKKAAKRKKGDSASVTFQLYQEGKGIDEIAQVRSLKRGTIESHVTSLIKDGKINIYDIMPKEEVDEVTKKWQKVADLSTSEFKNAHGTDQSYGQLRMIKAWMDLMASEG